MLTLQGQLVLLKHVLRAIPVFYFMALSLNKDGLRDLEQICRDFLWGPGESGHPRVPLVAWATISQPMADGGLGILPFAKQAQLLKLRCTAQLIEGQHTTWVRMVEVLIKRELCCGPFKRERRS